MELSDTCDEVITESLTPSPSSESSESSETVRLYLSGLARQTTKASLEAYFAEYNPKDIVVKDRGDAIAFKFVPPRVRPLTHAMVSATFNVAVSAITLGYWDVWCQRVLG